ncbi:MerR family transcriptional regulator [Sphingomonas desiccabilis]|uniref:MerR family transcriptional regulator n=1 Tax=Sphingomonas desiccabilis TaxID=429134 RepID=UPI001812326B|nr:MerR family transcriptional regulator [Sphingomonas desiccabilis]MBB3912148.1 DNA-binding transcriptional MerR regulator [Sphingomonas desiccabilis]
MSEKSATAFRTIGEVAAELGLPQHRLRYWESRFSELRPVTRAGQRRYYRPEDVALVRRIHQLLSDEGYTIRGVQTLLAAERGKPVVQDPLLRIRAMLADALAADAR